VSSVLSAFGIRTGPTVGERVGGFLIEWGILAVGVWVAANVVEGINYDGWRTIGAVSLILGLVNALARPLLVWLSLPVTIVSFGLFLVVINATMLWLTDRLARHFSQLHFAIDHFFWDAILGAVVISIVGWLLGVAIKSGWRLPVR
jgi:putative membrane protein